MSFGANKARDQISQPPDFEGAAGQQSVASKAAVDQSTMVNRPTVNTPLGSQSWEQNPDGSWKQNVSLSPEQQMLYDKQTANQGGIGDLATGAIQNAQSTLSQPFDASKVEGGQQQIQDAMYRRSTAMLDPQYNQRENAERTRLSDQGFQTGTAGFDTAMGNFNRDRAGAYGDARDRSIAAGQDAQKQAVEEALMTRNQPISEITAMMGGSKATQPQFQATPAAGVYAPIQSLQAADLRDQTNQDTQAQILGVQNASKAAIGQIGGGMASMASKMF